MNLADIKARHAHIENQERTQSVELLAERRSKSHKDRAWLIEQLEAAEAENVRLQGELDKLSVAVAEVKSELEKPKQAKTGGKKRAKKASTKTAKA